jgi:hypothetical protein
MNVLSGFPSPRLPDYDNNLVFSILYGELVTLLALVPGSIVPHEQRTAHWQNSPIHKIYPSARILATFFESRVFCNIDRYEASG